jgi:hypothetical protein
MYTLFRNVDLDSVSINRNTCDIVPFKQKQLDFFCDEWKVNIHYKPKLKTYCLFKHVFGTEKYISLNLDREDRSFIAQYRLGILPLRIETGRINNKKVHETICTLCNSNQPENEIHFVFDCPAYNTERQKFFTTIIDDYSDFSILNTETQLIYLFEHKPRIFAKFIKECYYKRRSLLYI